MSSQKAPKFTKFVATRCQKLRLKCTKFNFGWGSPIPLGVWGDRKGRGGKDKEKKEGEEKERGACRDERPLSKILSTPLIVTAAVHLSLAHVSSTTSILSYSSARKVGTQSLQFVNDVIFRACVA